MRCDEQRTRAVATALISSGRVVPALDMDPATGAYRSWWRPLPSEAQRSLIASLLDEDRSSAAQAAAAAAAWPTRLTAR